MTVFVVHPIRQEDTSPASKWGAFRFINSGYVYGDELWPVLTQAVDSAPQWTIPPSVMSNLRRAASEYNPERDYVLIAGDHIQLVALIAEIAYRYDVVRILRFDKKIADYIPVQVQMELDKGETPVVGLDSDIGKMNSGQDSDQSDASEDPAGRAARRTIEVLKARGEY